MPCAASRCGRRVAVCRRMSISSRRSSSTRCAGYPDKALCAGCPFCFAIIQTPQKRKRVGAGGQRQPGFHGTRSEPGGNGRRHRIPSECGTVDNPVAADAQRSAPSGEMLTAHGNLRAYRTAERGQLFHDGRTKRRASGTPVLWTRLLIGRSPCNSNWTTELRTSQRDETAVRTCSTPGRVRPGPADSA